MRPRSALALLLCAGCLDLGQAPRTGVYGRLTAGPGAIFLERGPLHEGTFERFGPIGEDGRFEVDLPAGGTWGVHVYLEGYFYLPLEVEVREDFETRIEQPSIDWGVVRDGPSWGESGEQPMDPAVLAPIVDDDPGDNPVVAAASVTPVGPDAPGTYLASMDVSDPDGDLSRQTLLGNEATGMGVQLNAPGPSEDGNFPDGTYTATVYLPDGWTFVAADHGCSNSALVRIEP